MQAAGRVHALSKDSGIDAEIKREPSEHDSDDELDASYQSRPIKLEKFEFPSLGSQHEVYEQKAQAVPIILSATSLARIEPRVELPSCLQFYASRAIRLKLDVTSFKMYQLSDPFAPPVPLLSLIDGGSSAHSQLSNGSETRSRNYQRENYYGNSMTGVQLSTLNATSSTFMNQGFSAGDDFKVDTTIDASPFNDDKRMSIKAVICGLKNDDFTFERLGTSNPENKSTPRATSQDSSELDSNKEPTSSNRIISLKAPSSTVSNSGIPLISQPVISALIQNPSNECKNATQAGQHNEKDPKSSKTTEKPFKNVIKPPRLQTARKTLPPPKQSKYAANEEMRKQILASGMQGRKIESTALPAIPKKQRTDVGSKASSTTKDYETSRTPRMTVASRKDGTNSRDNKANLSKNDIDETIASLSLPVFNATNESPQIQITNYNVQFMDDDDDSMTVDDEFFVVKTEPIESVNDRDANAMAWLPPEFSAKYVKPEVPSDPLEYKEARIVLTRLEDEGDRTIQGFYQQFLIRRVKDEPEEKASKQRKKRAVDNESEETPSTAHFEWTPDEVEDELLDEMPSPPPKPERKKRNVAKKTVGVKKRTVKISSKF